MPVGTALHVTNRVAKAIENKVLDIPEVKHCSMSIGSVSENGMQLMGMHQARCVVHLHDQYVKRLDSVIAQIRAMYSGGNNEEEDDIIKKLEGARIVFSRQGGTFGALSGQGGVTSNVNAPVIIEIKKQA